MARDAKAAGRDPSSAPCFVQRPAPSFTAVRPSAPGAERLRGEEKPSLGSAQRPGSFLELKPAGLECSKESTTCRRGFFPASAGRPEARGMAAALFPWQGLQHPETALPWPCPSGGDAQAVGTHAAGQGLRARPPRVAAAFWGRGKGCGGRGCWEAVEGGSRTGSVRTNPVVFHSLKKE